MTSWYQWVFEGVGSIAVVSACGFLLRRFFKKKMSDERDSRTVSSGDRSRYMTDSPVGATISGQITDSQVAFGSNIIQSVEVHHHFGKGGPSQEWAPNEPTPIQILREIDAALPFDREHAKQKYKDLEVVWETSILRVRAQTRGCDVGTIFRQEGSPSVLVDFRLSSVPAELKSATEGSVLLVSGTIESVHGWAFGIDLRPDPKIRIVKRT